MSAFPRINYPGHWVEITEELYWYCVGVLPPIYGPDGMFAIDEPAWHNRFGEAGYNICKSIEAETFWMTQGTVRDMNSPGFWKEPTDEISA